MRRLLVLLALAMTACALPATAGAATLHATPSTLASVYAGSTGGDTILLATGSYGSWNGGAKLAPGVTIAPEPGATPSFSGGDFGSTVRNLTIRGVRYTGGVEVTPSSTPLNLTFDGDDWGNSGHDIHEGRLSIIGGGTNALHSNGVKVMNSTFGPGGCSDGIQDSSKGTEIGPGNEFKGIVQGSCAEHSDAIQPYASNYVHIHDNYLHDNEQGIMSPDGVSTGYLIENNVIHTSTGYPCMHLGDTRNGVVRHNVCRNGSIRVYGGNQNVASQAMTVQDNAAGIDASACTGCTINHNQTVTYTGGTGRCAYATASPKGTASDGGDIGLNDCAASPPPPPPPPDHTPIGAFTVSPGSPTVGQTVTFNVAGSTCEDAPCAYAITDEHASGSYPLANGPGPTLTFTFQDAHPASDPVHAVLRVTDTDGDVSAAVSRDITVTAVGPPPPPPDRDGDGIPDASDACPDQPGTQPNGCPPPTPPPAPTCADVPECVQLRAQAADLTAQLAAMTASRDSVQAIADAYKARAQKAESQVARIVAIGQEP